MNILKITISILLFILAVYIGSKGFYLPNSSAADVCFGVSTLLVIFGFVILVQLQ